MVSEPAPSVPPAAPVAPAPPAAPRAWPLVVAAVVVLIAGTAVASVTAVRAEQAAERREEVLADQTANLAVATLQQMLAAISGVSGLAGADGIVDRTAFEAYARDATAQSPLEVVGFVPAAPGEAETTRADVQWVTSVDDASDDLADVGLDDDAVRQATNAARDGGGTVTVPVGAARPDRRAVVLVHPLYPPGTDADTSVDARREAIVGYVVAGIRGTSLVDAVDTQVADPIAVRIEGLPEQAGAPATTLAATSPAPDEGTAAERTVGDRAWRIVVDDRQPTTLGAAWWLLVGTGALTLSLALLAQRAARHRRDIDRHVAMIEHIAGLGRSLTGAGSVDELSRVIAAEVPDVLGARRARLHPAAARRPPPARRDDPDIVLRRPVTGKDETALAVLEVAWEQRRAPDDLTLAGLSTVVEMCGQTLVRARLADDSRRDAVSSRLLAGLAEAAASASTTDEVARTLVARAAELPGAQTAHIGLLTEDGTALTVVHPLLDLAGGALPDVCPLDAPQPIVEAVRQATPVLLGDPAAVAERFPAAPDRLRAGDVAAIACLPLVGADGRPFGALSFEWATPQSFEPPLVDVLRTTADLCASSLGRAQGTDRDRAHSTSLASLAQHLSASTTFDEVGAGIVAHAPAALDADFALLGVVEDDGFHLLAPRGAALDVLEPYVDTDLDSDFPPLIALRRRDLVTFRNPDDVPDPSVSADLASMGLRSGACAPLIDHDGTATGVFMAMWSDPPGFDDELRARIATVADLCAQSAERSRLADAEHRVRRDLQRSMVADAPRVEGLDVATRYRPAAREVGMGGDWYDSILLEDGRLCVVVGDVSGHGVGAIAAMTQVRTVVHTLVAGGLPLSDILLRTSAMMQRDQLGYATVLIALIDTEAGTVAHVTAGHPPALLRRPGGSVDTLTGGRHSVLGIALAPKFPGQVPFPPGATLVIYTDGLIERRGTAIDDSVAALAEQVRTAGGDTAGGLADHLLDHSLTVDSPQDDVALVVARRTA